MNNPTTTTAGQNSAPVREQTITEYSWRDWIPYFVAISILIFYGLRLISMAKIASSSTESIWAHHVYLTDGLEALAFSAAGFLFGKEVHRKQAEKAEKHASSAEARASQAESQANQAHVQASLADEKGRMLGQFVQISLAPNPSTSGDQEEFGPGQAPQVSPDELKAIYNLAQQLYP